ncbi:P-loop containing nucleoside triphosphate hydrolase protein [Tricholoma matsutake]|nr:P-loop containing nucleoside triphosphate hydrolase protein [Tricholoma matsutake 945]
MLSEPPSSTTGHRRRARSQPTTQGEQIIACKPCTEKELEGLSQKIADQFGWQNGPHIYQMDGIKAQLQMCDAIIHAGTGLGKTGVAAGLHVHPSAKGKITIMVSLLIALHNEMVDTFCEEFKLNATAVNSSNGGCAPKVLEKIVQGDSQIVLISPELLLSCWFIKEVLKNLDKNGFHKKYGELGIIQTFLSKSTPIIAVSATLPGRNNFVNIDVGNDRPNISLVIHAIQHSLNSYTDLNFIIDQNIMDHSEIQKGFLYCDNIAMGTEIIDHLTECLPPHLRKLGLIQPYNACFLKEYQKAVMEQFKTRQVQILVCTDAAGMGCNILDVDLVVQWKLPGSISAFVQ